MLVVSTEEVEVIFKREKLSGIINEYQTITFLFLSGSKLELSVLIESANEEFSASARFEWEFTE